MKSGLYFRKNEQYVTEIIETFFLRSNLRTGGVAITYGIIVLSLYIITNRLYRWTIMVPAMPMKKPIITKTQSKNFSQRDSLGPNIFKCAAAGRIMLTDMVNVIPTNAQI